MESWISYSPNHPKESHKIPESGTAATYLHPDDESAEDFRKVNNLLLL